MTKLAAQPLRSASPDGSLTAPPRTRPDAAALVWADRIVQGFLRHWLALVLAGLLVFTGLPLLAPAAMAAGWTGLGKLIYTLYIPFCHQLPQRSWFLFGPELTYTLAEIQQVYPATDPWELRFFYGTPALGWKVAWSDRMVSFYTMTPVFGLAYALLRRWWPALDAISLKVFIFSLLPLTLDGVSHGVSDALFGVSSGGFRDSNAWLAFLTGNAFPGFYAGDHAGTLNWWLRLLTGLLAAWGLAFFTFPWVNHFFRAELARYRPVSDAASR